jgi:two-component system sensor histidine kinase TctE
MPLAETAALRSMRARLLAWLSVALLTVLGWNTWASYRAGLESAQLAYDRLLVTSAHAIADLIRLERGKLVVGLPYAALEIYGTPGLADDSGERGQLLYRVGFFRGEYLAGDADMPAYTGRPQPHPIYHSMIDLYDSTDTPEPMRVAALLQPVESFDGSRLVMVQVAEPLRPRRVLARRILTEALLRHALVLVVALAACWALSTLALRPLRELARKLDARSGHDLAPVQLRGAPAELDPLIAGFNVLLGRLAQEQEQQRRFVADASHQLRTPLTVLQLQAEAGLKGDIPAGEALASVAATTQRASHLAEQLLSLARAQQSNRQEPPQVFDLRELASEVAVELSPLVAAKSLDFHFECEPAPVSSHRWMVREVLLNLLKNALEFTPEGGSLGLRLARQDGAVALQVWDSGPGLSEAMVAHVFEPFATDRPTRGAGLGLAICKDLAEAAGFDLTLENRPAASGHGLVAHLRFDTGA